MPKTKISEFSATPANNTDIDSINIAEGCAPSGINDAIRELMAQLKDWQSGTSNDPYVVGSSGSLTLNQGTANGVAYLNGSKVVTSGSALTFDGTTFQSSVSASGEIFKITGTGSGAYTTSVFQNTNAGGYVQQIFNVGASGASGQAGIQYAPTLFCSFGTLANDATTPITFKLNGSEQMRLTSTGLGIGTSSPTTKLSITDSAGPIIRMVRTSNRFEVSADTDFMSLNARDASTYITFKTADTERARIDSSGNLGVGQTPTTSINQTAGTTISSSGYVQIQRSAANPFALARFGSSSGTITDFYYNATSVGTISITASATAYNTSSDYRLKNIDGPLTGSGDFIDALKPKVGTWKADGSKFVGFLAHEVQEVSPQTVVGEKDAVDEDGKPVMQAMEYGSSEFIANIVAELQSLRKRLADAGI